MADEMKQYIVKVPVKVCDEAGEPLAPTAYLDFAVRAGSVDAAAGSFKTALDHALHHSAKESKAK